MDSAECVLIRSRRAVLLHTPYSPPGLDSYTASVIGWDYHVHMYVPSMHCYRADYLRCSGNRSSPLVSEDCFPGTTAGQALWRCMHGAWVLQSPEGGQLSGLDSRSSPRAAAAAIMNASPFGNGEAWQMIGPHAAFCALIGREWCPRGGMGTLIG